MYTYFFTHRLILVLSAFQSCKLGTTDVFFMSTQPNVNYCLLNIFCDIFFIQISSHPKNKYFLGLWVFIMSINVILLYSHLIPAWICSIISSYYLFLVLYTSIYEQAEVFHHLVFLSTEICLAGHLALDILSLSVFNFNGVVTIHCIVL
jgi:hypothetical protein